jgi:hypothetical protein
MGECKASGGEVGEDKTEEVDWERREDVQAWVHGEESVVTSVG